MLIRRFSQNRRNLGLATLGVAFMFCVYLYYDLHNQLRQNEEKNQHLKSVQNSLSTQLQVVYEHKSRLERAIQDEKDSHHRTKEAKQDLEMKLNRDKQELHNRIQTVNQKQRILQTQFEDLQKELSKSEADYQMLKSDHEREIEKYKEKILQQHKQCESDRKYLTVEITELHQSKKEISESLTQCQEALRESKAHSGILRENNLPQQLDEDVKKMGSKVNRSLEPNEHIDQIPVASPQFKNDNAFPDDAKKNLDVKKEIPNDARPVTTPAFHPGNNGMTDLMHIINRAEKMADDGEHQLQVAVPPPVNGKKLNADDPLDQRNMAWNAEHGIDSKGLNAAIIEAPNEVEDNHHIKIKPEEEEDADVKNDQNENDQKEDEDYQYDKNADEDEKNEDKVDDFPDAVVEKKSPNKIQNPVYPDDVEVVNH